MWCCVNSIYLITCLGPLETKTVITSVYHGNEILGSEVLGSVCCCRVYLFSRLAGCFKQNTVNTQLKGIKHPLCVISVGDNGYDELSAQNGFSTLATVQTWDVDCYAEAVLAALFVISLGHVVCQQVMIYRLHICCLIYLGKYKMLCGFRDVVKRKKEYNYLILSNFTKIVTVLKLTFSSIL